MPAGDNSGASSNENSNLPSYCPNCGYPVRAGELICTNCSYSLVGSAISSATKTLGRAEETFDVTRPKIGSAIRRAQKVAFIIDGDLYKLPPAQLARLLHRSILSGEVAAPLALKPVKVRVSYVPGGYRRHVEAEKLRRHRGIASPPSLPSQRTEGGK